MSNTRPRLNLCDRLFWVSLRSVWRKWTECLVIVKPETVVRWHRAAFKRHWRLLSGFLVSERTVSRYLPRGEPDARKRQNWLTFLKNHRDAISAMEFFTVPTVAFRVLYVFFVIHHARRTILHLNVTEHPTSEWVCQQVREAFPYEDASKYLIFDRDSTFDQGVRGVAESFGTKPVRLSLAKTGSAVIPATWRTGVPGAECNVTH